MRVICKCVGSTFVRRRTFTGSFHTNEEHTNTNYGNRTSFDVSWSFEATLVSSTEDDRRAILQFEIPDIDFAKIKTITLVNHSASGFTRQRDFEIASVVVTSGSVNVENRITWNNMNSILSTQTIMLAREQTITALSEWRVDITPIFNRNAFQNNIFSIRLRHPMPAPPDTLIFHARNRGTGFPFVEIEMEPMPSLPPINLLPISTKNPKAPVTFSWWHNPNPELPIEDPQIASELTVWQDGPPPRIFTIEGDVNEITLPENTFTQYTDVFFTVRTKTEYNGWGEMSEAATFPFAETPPLPPSLIFPVGISVSGLSGVLLEWSYNSPFDTFATRFDIRYRIDGGVWIDISNYSDSNTPARATAMTQAIEVQARVDWQVRAYGELGDVGSWSDVATFFTIGIPKPPTIVSVTNSNRPTINFSAQNLMSWEIEIWKNGSRIYETGNQPFTGEYQHITNQFFANGNYIARMRGTNEFGITSGCVERPFTIHTIPPEAMTLSAVNNLRRFIRLCFNNEGSNTVYVYRSVWQENKFLRIGKTTGCIFDDYTAAPGVRYEYFARAVTAKFSFADSNRATGLAEFAETTFAEYNNLQGMLFLEYQAGGIPTKDATFAAEKSLTQFTGRSKPVLQVGEHTSNSISFSFYCSRNAHERLKKLAESGKVLLMRDKRHGSIFGTIAGSITTRLIAVLDGFVVSFAFTEVDFRQEVDIE